jgi:Uncharacterized anaerobic dehydrogenase
MFKRIASTGPARPAQPGPAGEVPFTFDGRSMAGAPGDTVAAALLANGVRAGRRTPVGGSPRGPYCMMGVCFDCLVTIDGAANQQGCMIPLRAGMQVRTQPRPRPLQALEEQA